MEPMSNGRIEAAAATLTTAAALPMSDTGEQGPDAGLDLARMMSGIDRNIGPPFTSRISAFSRGL